LEWQPGCFAGGDSPWHATRCPSKVPGVGEGGRFHHGGGVDELPGDGRRGVARGGEGSGEGAPEGRRGVRRGVAESERIARKAREA